MKCPDNVGEYCATKIKYKKHAEVIGCNKCCVNCEDRCLEVCSIVEGGKYARLSNTDK